MEDVAKAVDSTAATLEAVADTPMEEITVKQTQAPTGETVVVTNSTEPTGETATVAKVSSAEPQIAEVRLSTAVGGQSIPAAIMPLDTEQTEGLPRVSISAYLQSVLLFTMFIWTACSVVSVLSYLSGVFMQVHGKALATLHSTLFT